MLNLRSYKDVNQNIDKENNWNSASFLSRKSNNFPDNLPSSQSFSYINKLNSSKNSENKLNYTKCMSREELSRVNNSFQKERKLFLKDNTETILKYNYKDTQNDKDLKKSLDVFSIQEAGKNINNYKFELGLRN